MKYSADLTINVHKKCEKSTKIEISAISSQKYWHAKIFLYVNHTKPEFFPKFSWSHLWSNFHETWTTKSRIKWRNESGRFGALKSDSTHHYFRNACTKSGSLRFSQFSGCWLILSVYIIMSLDFPFLRLFGVR